MATELFKAIAAASNLMGKKDIRAYLNGVHVTQDGRVWATNGIVAVSIIVKDVPEWLAGKNIDESCIAHVVKAVRAYKAKVVPEMYETIEECEDWLGVKVRFNEQSYPDVDRVMNREWIDDGSVARGFMHGFKAESAMAIAKCNKELGCKLLHVPQLTYNGSAYVGAVRGATYALMPLRVDG